MAIINSVIVGGGSPTPTGKYQLLQRVKDDSNNEIGTVCGFHTDANNVEYAVVCLDAQYRLANGQWLNYKQLVSNLPVYSNSYAAYTAKETATFNCDKIMEYCVAGRSSDAVSHCRGCSFVIGGTTYYGQLPSLVEVLKVLEKATEINNADVTASTYPSLIIPSESIYIWSSTQRSTEMAHNIYQNGATTGDNKTSSYFVIPILELPNA